MKIINDNLESKILKLLKKHDLLFLPGELDSTNETVDAIEENYSSFDKTIHVDKKKLKIFKYEKIVDIDNRDFSFMMVMDYKDLRYVFKSLKTEENLSSARLQI